MAYQPGANSGTGSTDGSSFPTSGSGTQDSIYGISGKLAVVPVKISNTAQPDHAGLSLDPQGASGTPNIVPWESALAQLYQMTPGELASLQQSLYQAGLYPKSYYGKTPDVIVPGEIDPGTQTAWRDAVEEAVRSSTYDNGQISNAKSVQDVITGRIAMNQQSGGVSGGTVGVRLTNPADLRMVAKDLGQKFLGRNPDPGFVDNYVAAYHAAEVASQNVDKGGNVTAPPDPQAFAEQMLRQQYPVDVGVNDALNVGNELVNSLSKPAGAALPVSYSRQVNS